MDYKALAQQTAQEILGYYQDTSGWKVVKNSKKITVSSKASKKFHGNLYRVEGVIPESTSKLSDFLFKPENRVTWDKALKMYNIVLKIDSCIPHSESADVCLWLLRGLNSWICLLHQGEKRIKHALMEDTFICHTITQSFAMGSISPRDFIDLVSLKHYEGNMDVVSATSVDFPAYPPSSSYIRGYNHACGYVCLPVQENPAYSKLVMFVQTEMRGKLAPSITEATMPSNLVNFMLNVKDGIKTQKIPSRRGYHHNGHSSFLKKK